MKEHKRKFILFFFSIFFSDFLIFSNENKFFSFRVTPKIELANGQINEYVFSAACKNENYKLSELDWDFNNIPVISICGEFDFIKYIHAQIKFCSGMPKQSGYMQDYDWLNSVAGPTTPDTEISWLNDSPYEVTNYSRHNNELQNYTTFSLGIGTNIFLPQRITLTPAILYYYDYLDFISKDGFTYYKYNNWNVNYHFGKAISYKQETNALLLALKMHMETFDYIVFDADFFFSPAMTFLNAIDYHYVQQRSTGTAFWDEFTNIWQVGASTQIQYRFNKSNSAGISASVQYIPLYHGNTRVRGIDANGNLDSEGWSAPHFNTGGTERIIWKIGLSYSFSL